MALNNNWSMQGWKVGPVTLQEAFGIKKGTVKFPPLQATLPSQVASSQQQAPKGGNVSGATGGNSPTPGAGQPSQNAALGQKMAAGVGWTGAQWTALNNIVMAESGWYTTIHNGGGFGYVPGLAYGIPQALPGSKMASAGANWQTSAATQIKWMLGYIRSTYGNPVNAWAFHQANGYY